MKTTDVVIIHLITNQCLSAKKQIRESLTVHHGRKLLHNTEGQRKEFINVLNENFQEMFQLCNQE